VYAAQIPPRLCAAFSKVVSQHSSFVSRSAFYATQAASDNLGLFLEGYFGLLRHFVSTCNIKAADNVAVIIQQQVLQSGLLQSLPLLVDALSSALAAKPSSSWARRLPQQAPMHHQLQQDGP
jgi:hypothetical protein